MSTRTRNLSLSWGAFVAGALVLGSGAATAQNLTDSVPPRPRLPFTVTMSVGLGGPGGNTRCIPGGYLVSGVEVQNHGVLFVSGEAEWIFPAGPIEDCGILPAVSTLSDGNVLVRGDRRLHYREGGGHFTVGAGVQAKLRKNIAELKLKTGIARGHHSFPDRWGQSIAVGATMITLGNLVLSAERSWFRVPYAERQYATAAWPGHVPDSWPAGARTLWTWKGINIFSIGFRF